MAEGTAEIAPKGKQGAGHFIGKIQQGELLQAFDEHGGPPFQIQIRDGVLGDMEFGEIM
jgi:hypothetical protein